MNATVIDLDADRKSWASLQAEFALAGYQAERLADGSFMVARWGLVKPLADLAAVAAFAEQAGVR